MLTNLTELINSVNSIYKCLSTSEKVNEFIVNSFMFVNRMLCDVNRNVSWRTEMKRLTVNTQSKKLMVKSIAYL